MEKVSQSWKARVFYSRTVFLLVCTGLLGFLLASIVMIVRMGSVDISIGDIFSVVVYQLFGIGDAQRYGTGTISDIVWFIRLPRIFLAIAVGMGLSVCGVVMQAVVKNPLADPYILGISSGASLGATVAILLGVGAVFGGNFVGIMAFLGAFLVSLLVQGIANLGGRSNAVKLVLAGMALSAVCTAFSNLAVYMTNDSDGVRTVTYWLMGSLAAADWTNLAIVLPCILAGSLFFWTQSRTLNLMLLGDETAVTLGIHLSVWRHVFLLISSAMIGLLVYSSGTIGFVGLVIPHMIRMLFGTNHKRLIPLTALTGSVFLLWSDILCRVVIPGTELPIGILTSAIGAPCFLFLMIRKKYGFGEGAR